MNFQESVEYLLSLGNEVLAMKLGLDNIRTLLDALGRPQDKYLKVQVAGTNGKGSVCAFLNSICIAAGIRVGMFTSPHLISITERVQISGVEISEDDFGRFATRVRDTADRLVQSGELENVPTFFEQVTAIALLALADAKVEVAILETGLGGRLDATTAANAEIAVITRIDLDHQRYLGDTIEQIASEKAAIIRDEFQRVVIGEQQPEALRVILDRCKQVGINDLDWEPHLRWQVDSVDPAHVRVATARHIIPSVELGLRGKHQRENAETAINVIRILRYDYDLSIGDDDVITGLREAHHPGRLESIGHFLLDGAHNAGGARALRDYLDEFVQQPITMIFGAMNDKDARELLSILAPAAEVIILTQADSPRSRAIADLERDLPESFDRGSVIRTENVANALKVAFGCTPPGTTVLVTGSLYLVGEVKRILQEDASNKLKTEK